MWLATLILLQVPTSMDVAVQPLSGVKQAGALVALDSQSVAVEIDGKRRAYDIRDLLTLVVDKTDVAAMEEATVFVVLVDGSRILGSGYRVKDRTAEIQIGTRSVPIETRNIHTVRFHAPTDALDTQWKEIVAGDNKGDVIVLRRSPTALDQLEGVFHDVSDETVEFEYDDQRIPVKRTKLEGMVYYHPLGRDFPVSICGVQETGGTNWRTRSVELKDGQLHIVTSAGTKCQLPWDMIARLDFSSGNVAYLSDLEFDLAECTPYIASRISPERIMQLYAPRRDKSFEGPGLWLANDDELQQFDKGLAVHSRSQLVYRLTEPYRKLTAVAGIDSRLQGRGNLVLVIEGDNKELFRRDISGKDAPLAVDLNIEGVRRLKILVDFGGSLDVADHLNLCNARITK